MEVGIVMAGYGDGIACMRGAKGLDDSVCWRWVGDG